MKEKISNKREQKGITLVALVITIVVLLILAGVSIVTLFGENGIITAAQKAAEQTKDSVNRDLAELKKLEAMLDPWQEVKNEKGQVVAVEKGSKKLEIGEYINYDCTNGGTETASYTSKKYDSNKPNQPSSGNSKNQTFKASDYTGQWRVLGAENGELLIMAADNVPLIKEGSTTTEKRMTLASGVGKSYVKQAKVAYKYAIEELDNISKIYAKGKGASGKARSIKVEDVNDITGYKPEMPAGSADNKYGKGSIIEYGNKVTYTWKGENAPYYSGSNGKSSTMTLDHSSSGFTYWDESTKDFITSPYTSTSQTNAITTLTSTFYMYYPETLTTSSNISSTTGISNNSKQRDMLFGNSSSEKYLLGSRYISNQSNYTGYGIFCVNKEGINVDTTRIASSGFYPSTASSGVRPVVYLSSDIKLKEGTPVGEVKSWDIE